MNRANPAVSVQEPFISDLSTDSGAHAIDVGRDATALLIRHAHTSALGVSLSGRAPVALSPTGCQQADRLGRTLAATCRLAAVYTSPLERARATAAPVEHYQSVALHDCNDLNEIDFGRWTGHTFVELEADPAWRRFNSARDDACVPHGESPAAVQRRILQAIERLTAAHPGEIIAIVSHAEVLRCALLRYLSLSLDRWKSLPLEPASVSAIAVSRDRVRVLYVNDITLAAR